MKIGKLAYVLALTGVSSAVGLAACSTEPRTFAGSTAGTSSGGGSSSGGSSSGGSSSGASSSGASSGGASSSGASSSGASGGGGVSSGGTSSGGTAAGAQGKSGAGNPSGEGGAAASGDGGSKPGAGNPIGAGGESAGAAGDAGDRPACLSSQDCSNGAECSGAGACVCSPRFNGTHCEFQAFRGLGALQGDTDSVVNNVSHDGTVVVGLSYGSEGNLTHAVRSVNGAALQYIPEPASLTPSSGCGGVAVDSSGSVLLQCEQNKAFLYTTSAGAVPVDLSPSVGLPADISSDGKVIVGTTSAAPNQEFRHANGATGLLGVLEPGGSSYCLATNADGSIVVGFDSLNLEVASRWTAATGLTALPGLSDWLNFQATDITPDGKVIVGWAATAATDELAIKWSGPELTPTVLGPGSANTVSADGRVIAGFDLINKIATLWNDTGVHAIQDLLGATPDLTADWSLGRVSSISDDGKVLVGTGTHGTHDEGWVAHLP
jgi:hypothetical protein